MATFTWGFADQAFVWDSWWDFTGINADFDVDGTTTSSEVQLYNAVDDVRIIIGGTGFSPTGSETQPTSGTITSFQVLEQGDAAVTLTGINISVPTFLVYLATANVDGFLNTVLAGADTLSGNALGDTLHGLTGNDTMNGLGGNDTLFGDGGNDTLNGGLGADVLNGGGGNDKLIGAAGQDQLIGGIGVDTFNGGAGVDTCTGGAGSDYFVLNVAGAANRDIITDFSVADDTIRLENSVFTALGGAGVLGAGLFHIGAAAHDVTDRIIYNSANGKLLYDADGNNAGAAVQIALLDTGLALTNADFVVI